jgi:hypothetical protein
MAGIEDVFKGGNVVTGLAIGVGATVLAPIVAPILRPLAKTALKAGVVAYDQGRAALAEFNKGAEQLVSEVRQEMAEPAAPENSTKRVSAKAS